MRAFARILLILFFSAITLTAAPEIVNENLLMDPAVKKIDEMITELHTKTGVSVVLHAKKSLGNQNIVDYEKNISASLASPYVLLVLADKEQKVDIVVSKDLAGIVEKNNILNNFIIPIISASDKNTQISRYSAAILNGVAEIVDETAKSKDVILLSSIGDESKNTTNVIRFIVYGLTAILVIGTIYRRFTA